MKIIDLTHTFTSSMPVFPGDPPATLMQVTTIEKDGYTDHQLKTNMHVGTHMDAPLHMVPDGKRIDEISVEKYFGRGVLVDGRNCELIDETLLENKKIERGDIVLVFTGLGQSYRTKEYFQKYPSLTEQFAQRLVDSRVSIVGMDMLSPDKSPYPVHKILLGSGILIIENLTNLDHLLGINSFEVIALPAKLQSDSAPVRVVARV